MQSTPRLLGACLAAACGLAVPTPAPAQTASPAACAPVTYDRYAAMFALEAAGVGLGPSRKELTRLLSERGWSVESVEGRMPADLRVVADKQVLASRELAADQREDFLALSFQRDRLTSVFATVHAISRTDREVTSTDDSYSTEEVREALADYRCLLAWRFGAVGDRSDLPAAVRSAFLGPVQILNSMTAEDRHVAVDVFATEDIGHPHRWQIAVIYRTPTSGSRPADD